MRMASRLHPDRDRDHKSTDFCVVLAATTSITVSLLAAPAAEARCRSCAAGAGVAAGMVTGTIVGSAIANTFFYASLGTIVAMRRLRRRLQSNQLDLDKDNNRF
jgi:Ca2+/Na+ antiporter